MIHYIKVVVCLLVCLEGVYPQAGSVVIRSLVLEGNEHVSMNDVLFITLNIIKFTSLMLLPIIPNSANKVLDILNINLNERNFSFMNIKNQNKFQILNPKPIFPRIDKC